MIKRHLKIITLQSMAIVLLSIVNVTNASEEIIHGSFHYLIMGRESEPYQIINTEDPTGSSSGIVSDVLSLIFKGQDVEMNIDIYPALRAIHEQTKENREDWVTYGSKHWVEDSVKNNAIFIEPALFEFTYSLVSLKRNQFQPADTLEALRGSSLITIHGYQYPRLKQIEEDYDLNVHKAATHDAAIRMLTQGRADYYLAKDKRSKWAIKKHGMNLFDYNLHPIPLEIIPDPIHFIVKKTLNPEIIEFMGKRLREIKLSGELQEIVNRY